MQLITALFHPEKYPELAAKKWWKPVIYILFWTFFVTAVVNFINISICKSNCISFRNSCILSVVYKTMM